MTRRIVALVLAGGLLLGACDTTGGTDGTTGSAGRFDRSTETADRPDREQAPPTDVVLDAVRDRLDQPTGELSAGDALAAVQDGQVPLRDGSVVAIDDGVAWDGGTGGASTSRLRLLHGLLIVHDLVEDADPAATDAAYELVRDWATSNPREAPVHGMAWHDETTARRTSALVRMHDVLSEHPDQDADHARRDWLEAQLATHLELLLDDDFHATGTNHGMFQDRSLVAAAVYLDEREADSPLVREAWTTGRARLLDYFETSVTADGVHHEHTPAYHQLIAAAAQRDGRFLAAVGDDEGAAALAAVHDEMRRYATHVIQPDGSWPLVSDTFADEEPRPGLWDDPTYRFAATGGAEGEAPEQVAVAFEDAGYVVLRDRWSDDGSGTYLHFTAAYHTHYHKHADDLSVWLYHDGPLLTELGPNGYDYDDPLTQCAFSDRAHNLASVEGVELPRTDDRIGDTRLTDVDLSGPVWTATGRNDRLDEAAFERQLSYDPAAGLVEVVDRVTARDEARTVVRWHLDPDVEATVDGATVTLARDGRAPVTGSFAADVPLEVVLLGPDPDACAGLRFGQDEPIETATLEVRTAAATATEVVSRFELP